MMMKGEQMIEEKTMELEKELLSICCSSIPLNNTSLHDNLGICNNCREVVTFETEQVQNQRTILWKEIYKGTQDGK